VKSKSSVQDVEIMSNDVSLDKIKDEDFDKFYSSKPKVEKLTNWKKEPSCADLKEDLTAAKPSHDSHVADVHRWNELRDVTGAAKPKCAKGRSSVQPKLIRRQAEWRYSALSEPFLSSDKLFDVEPVTFEDDFAAAQNELVLNWQFRTKINKVKFIDDYVHTAVDEGGVIVRVGWDRLTETVSSVVPVFQYMEATDPEDIQILQEALNLKTSNPRGYLDLPEEVKASVDYYLETDIPTVAMVVGEEEIEEEKIIRNQPTVQIMDPSNIFIDPSCEGDIDKARFVIVSFETSKAELLKDGRYKNLQAVNWQGNVVLNEPDHNTKTPGDFNFKDELRKRVVAYEYWGYYDVEGKDELKPIVATWIGDVMIRMEDSPFPDEKPPFVVVPYLPVKRSLYGEPDAEILEDNQKILGAVTRGMIDLMGRSANSQQGVAKGFLDVTNKRRFERGEDYEFNPGAGDPRSSLFQHTYPEIPNSALTMVNLQNAEAEALSGVKSFAGGMSGEAYGEVAAGIKGVLDASAKREMNILRRLAKGIQDIGNKVMAMNAVFLSEEEVVRVTNTQFVKIRREDLKGNFDLIVDISTPEVDQNKANDLGFMLQTMGPNMDPELSKKILAKIADLKRMPDLAHDIRTYQPEPDPMVVKAQELEIAKLEAEIQKLQADAAYANARAAEAKSTADLKDLDYVEQETGTKHARDMQKQSEQARGNQDLEVTKAFLKSQKPEESSPDIEAAVGYNTLSDMNAQQKLGVL
jgi:hypothetical protein